MASRSRKEEEEGETMMGPLLLVLMSRWNDKERKHSFSRISLLHDDDDEEKEKEYYWSKLSYNLRRSPFPNKFPDLHVVGSCNGLLCLQYARGNDKCSVVWEASTDKLQVIPDPPSMQLPCDCDCGSDEECTSVEKNVLSSNYGLFFDAKSRDYKFVSFTTNYYEERDWEGECSLHHISSTRVQVYSVKNNSWKELSHPLCKDKHEISLFGVTCVNGVCYWLAYCTDDDHLILSFDLATERFSYFHYPAHKLVYYRVLMELDGSLCLVYYPRENWKEEEEEESEEKGPRRSFRNLKKVEIWEEGIISFWVYNSSSSSWTRRIDFDVSVTGFNRPLWFGKKNNKRINGGGYSLLLQGGPNKGDLLEYDYDTREFNTIIHDQIIDEYVPNIFPYVETKNNANINIWHMSSS